jgi:hypothetical protein
MFIRLRSPWSLKKYFNEHKAYFNLNCKEVYRLEWEFGERMERVCAFIVNWLLNWLWSQFATSYLKLFALTLRLVTLNYKNCNQIMRCNFINREPVWLFVFPNHKPVTLYIKYTLFTQLPWLTKRHQ